MSGVTASTTYSDGTILTGSLGANVKISIADGATVTLKDVTINGTNNKSYAWAGITCEGSATINLEGTNTVKGFDANYPGIQAGSTTDHTLTIQSSSGTGKLTASSNGYGSGIGGGFNISCGNIVIQSGIITATGGSNCTGIGNGYAEDGTSVCGDITINGGTVTATGGENGAGIGCGRANGCAANGTSVCGDITINGGTVTATGGMYGAGIGSGFALANNSGGESVTAIATCGNIAISGETVTATGGFNAAGIGGGGISRAVYTQTAKSICESITINGGTGQIQVTATKGENAIDCIGKGFTNQGGNFVSGVTGIISIGETTYWDGSNYCFEGASSYLQQNSLTYPSSSN